MGKQAVGNHSRRRSAAGSQSQVEPASRRHKQHQQIGDKENQRASQILGHHQHQHMGRGHSSRNGYRPEIDRAVKHSGHKEYKADLYKL